MVKYIHELLAVETRNHDRLYLYPARTSGARNALKHHMADLPNKVPRYLMDRIKTRITYILFPTKLNRICLIYTVMSVAKSIAIFATTTEHDD